MAAREAEAIAKTFADETPPVLHPGRGRTKTGQLWAYARDDRPWGGTDPPSPMSTLPIERPNGRAPTSRVLPASSRSTVMPAVGSWPSAVTLNWAFCWSHVRRRFYKLAAASPAPIASEALKRITGLYVVEAEIRGRTADERRAVRQEKSRPIVHEFETWLRAKLDLISQKTKLAEAIRYALSRWDGRASLPTAASRLIPTSSSALSAQSRSTARTLCSLAWTAAANTGPSSPH